MTLEFSDGVNGLCVRVMLRVGGIKMNGARRIVRSIRMVVGKEGLQHQKCWLQVSLNVHCGWGDHHGFDLVGVMNALTIDII